MRVLKDHIYYNGGAKTVCVSACLNHFGIKPDQYHYTSSNGNRAAYKNVLRRFGWSVRSRKSMFKISNGSQTLTAVKRMMAKSDYTASDKFLVECHQSKKGHLITMNGNGEVIVDTARGMKWRVHDICIVENKGD